MKTCTKCHIEKDESEFYKHSTGKNGLRPDCKECTNATQQKYIKANPDKIKEKSKKYISEHKEELSIKAKARYAANPEKVKNAVAIYSANNKEKISVSRAIYRINNLDAIKERDSIYREENKEILLIKKREYYAENKDELAIKSKIYREENKEEIKISRKKNRDENRDELLGKRRVYYAIHKDRILEKRKENLIKNPHKKYKQDPKKSAEYRKAHADSYRIHCKNRRAKQKGNGGKLSKGLRLKLFTLQRGCCAICKKKLDKLTKLQHLDHIIAVTLGGANEDWNMQLLCARCNLTKAAKDNIKHMQSLGYLL